jgi:EAL domain-containing protein (putative c-di-GMP-specific phosphodiesterase class I)/CheY-like chemotaxis protein
MTENFKSGNVLVVDDEEPLLRAVQRLLTHAGFKVDAASGGREAVELLEHRVFDCIVSDINMPGMSGIDLLRAVRGRDLDVPVVLLTGAPSLATAAEAVEYGAFQYLMKPVEGTTLVQMVAKATRLGRMARFKREALEVLGDTAKLAGDRAGLEAAFGRALDTLWMAYQPIVRASNGTLFAHETLVRTTEPAIPHPGALLDAAERLNRLFDLGRIIRAKSAASMDQAPEGTLLFVNLHPRDLLDEELVSPDAPLSRIASRVVLEITERASLDEVADSAGRVAALRQLGFRIAIDDLGAGYAGLTSFANLEPEIVKLDMSLVRGVDTAPKKRKIIDSMTRLCKDMGILVVAEGVETIAEREVLVEIGCDLLQGYLFAKPGKPFPEVRWEAADPHQLFPSPTETPGTGPRRA